MMVFFRCWDASRFRGACGWCGGMMPYSRRASSRSTVAYPHWWGIWFGSSALQDHLGPWSRKDSTWRVISWPIRLKTRATKSPRFAKIGLRGVKIGESPTIKNMSHFFDSHTAGTARLWFVNLCLAFGGDLKKANHRWPQFHQQLKP